MTDTSRDVTADVVREAIRSLKPKSKYVRPNVPDPARNHIFRYVMVVRRKDVITYLVKRHDFHEVFAILGVERLINNNEFTVWVDKDGKRYIDAAIGEEG